MKADIPISASASHKSSHTVCILIVADVLPESLQLCLRELEYQTHWHQASINDAMVLLTTLKPGFVIVDQARITDETDRRLLAGKLNIPLVMLTAESEEADPSRFDPIGEASRPYSMLPWPCANTTLLQTLSICAYKKNLQREMSDESRLLEKAYGCIGKLVITLDKNSKINYVNSAALNFFGVQQSNLLGKPWYFLLRTRNELSSQHTEQFISAAIKTRALTKLQPLAIQTSNQSSHLLDGIIGPIQAEHGNEGVVLILRPLANLDKMIFERPDLQLHDETRNNSKVSGMLLLSPDNFNKINLQLGRSEGDDILFAIGQLLRGFLRPTDLTCHYGGTVFLVMFSDTSAAQTLNLVSELHQLLNTSPFSETKLRLKFSLGLALNTELENYSPVELFFYANCCLAQGQGLGGNQLRQWSSHIALQQLGNMDRLSGNFSNNGDSDYQKMLMLWSILNDLSVLHEKSDFIQQLLTQLNFGFDLTLAGYFESTSNTLELVRALDHNNQAATTQQLAFSNNQTNFIQEMREETSESRIFTSLLDESGAVVLVPLKYKGKLKGLFWLAYPSGKALPVKDQHLVFTIADFVLNQFKAFEAVANKIQTNSVSTKIIQGSHFWYRSNEMLALMEQVKKVAPTNATVLITGESGTGKELLAKSIHTNSKRADKHFVIFDCGAVVENLVESELFGHIRGAFTGASKTSIGRIQDAEGGTLFLDEIGELPIDVQVKLLRFVQDKQFSPVGSNKLIKIDVRVIAATNVDLEQKIKRGEFREDLYYRLNVFNLHTVPLRARKTDVLLLAKKYLALYAQDYEKHIEDFTDLAKQALIDYDWPGNVRELTNIMHRAIILCNDHQMDCADLGLFPKQKVEQETPAEHLSMDPRVNFTFSGLASVSTSTGSTDNLANKTPTSVDNLHLSSQSLHFENSLDASKQVLTACIAAQQAGQPLYPVATWLEYLIFANSLKNNQHISLQAANQLRIAESTFRRRWKRLQMIDPPPEPSICALCEKLVPYLIRQSTDLGIIEHVTSLILQACQAEGLSVYASTQLLNVSQPTFRKMRSASNATE